MQFGRAKTPPNPGRASTTLVIEGPFRFTRNPMYLGLTLIYVGIAFAANSAWLLGLTAPLLIVMHFGVIVREEAYLERKFGDAYLQYRKTVRRWF
jgi:protein-S-isoprenylcysteine O-methyltransferase Ste14